MERGGWAEVREQFLPRLEALIAAAREGRVGESELLPVFGFLEGPRYLDPAAALVAVGAAGFHPRQPSARTPAARLTRAGRRAAVPSGDVRSANV
ncbi:hypothetical protein ACWGB8_27865 [Kitasatospora sp. NPDC054939]